MVKGIRFLFYALLTVIVAMLSMGNREDVTFTLFPLPFEFAIPKYLLMLAFLLMGMLLGVIFSYGQLFRRKTENWKHKKEVKKWQDRVKKSETTQDITR